MEWKTKVTELLGCKYPIVQGAMGELDWKVAAAVANAGAHGTIIATTSRTPERLRENIQRCRDATQGSEGSFSVNLSIGRCPRIEEMLEVCIEERVPLETSAYRPDSLARRIKESGLTWRHKSARVRDLMHAERLGVDAVIIVGLQGVGVKSPEQLPTMVGTIWAIRELKVPVIAAGGISEAHGFLGALGMGAAGIMMGTAFMSCKESLLKASFKEAIVQTGPDDPELRARTLVDVDPQAYAEVMNQRGKMPEDEWLRALEKVPLMGGQKRGQATQGSYAVAFIDRTMTVKELVDSIIQGAEKILDSLQFLKRK